MKRYVEFPLESDGSILVEVDEPETAGGTVRAGREADVPDMARLTFEEALGRIRPAAETVIVRLRDLSDPPDEVGVEFGLNPPGTGGAIVASAGVEADYKLTLASKRQERAGTSYRRVARLIGPRMEQAMLTEARAGSADLRTGIVRVLREVGTTAVTGFPVSADGLVVTCSHVVQREAPRRRGEPGRSS
jgi:hypothetical protein